MADSGLNIKLLTDKLKRAIANCSTEEDLRITMEFMLREALPDLPVPKYEKSIRTSTFRGRADAVHQGVVIEYEMPRTMSTPRRKTEAINQVCDYLTALTLGTGAPKESRNQPALIDLTSTYTLEDEDRLAANVGIATDGHQFVFVQRRGKKWDLDSRSLDQDTIEKFILWLRAMIRKDLSPENLIADFGPRSGIAANVVGILAQLVNSGHHPKANVIYDEWRRIFGIVYGTDQLQRARKSPEETDLATAYDVSVGAEFPVVLFAVHTYYALLMKMLATELIVAQGGMSDTFIGRLTRSGLRTQLEQLEAGDILRRQNIRNTIEQDFFGWYPEAWTQELQDGLWGLAQQLASYDIGTFELKPDRARDLLKDLYHGLIPESVRHALGEYYTPDWLAEHTINLSGYNGDPHTTFLDPSCGSGTFLVMAIQKVRRWLTDQPVEWGSAEKKREAVDLIIHNIVGFDLNPLAVIASRTNYLFALGPLLRYRSSRSDFEVPVYLTDSVLLPGRTPEQSGLFSEDTVPFTMTVGTFEVPREAVDARKVPDLMNLLHECVTDRHSSVSFVNRAVSELALSDDEQLRTALGTLFDTMAELEQQGKDGVWARLIRNRYAALLFRHYFDFVVGNPPHVNWEALTPDWRKAAEDKYKSYGLFNLTGLDSRHGGGKKDIAALFTYSVLDHFVREGAVLALVVHVSLFKTTGAGEGYRRFQLGSKEHFAIEEAHDFTSFQPFQTVPGMRIKTRTVTFRARKNETTSYPVPYTVWRKTKKGCILGSLTWGQAEERLESEQLAATPVRGTLGPSRLSPWLTISADRLASCAKVIAPPGYRPSYRGHAGAYSGGLNGAFFVEVLEHYPNGTVLIRNMHDEGSIKCPSVQLPIEADLLYPLLRGRSVCRWGFKTVGHFLVVQDPKTKKGFSEAWMQETHPLTWAYLKQFEELLRARKAFLKFFDPKKDPFYSMYDIAEYTFEPNKVAWMDISSTVKATVIPPGKNGMVMPEHHVMFVATETIDEAYYVCAVLNSDPVNTIVAGYIVDNCLSTHPVENVVIPRFDSANSLHCRLVKLSRGAHRSRAVEDLKGVALAQEAIDAAVGSLWADVKGDAGTATPRATVR